MPRSCARFVSILVVFSGGVASADVIYQNDFSGGAGAEWSDRTVGTAGAPFGTFLGNFERGTVRLTLGRLADDGSGGDGPGGDGVGSGVNTGVAHSDTSARGGGGGGGLGLGNFPGATRPFFGQSGGGGGDGGGGTDPGVEPGSYTLVFDLYLFDSWDGRDPIHGVDRFKVRANGSTIFNEALETFEPWENWWSAWVQAGSGAFDPAYKDIIVPQIRLNFTVTDPGELLTIDFVSEQNQPLHDESWGVDNVRVILNSGRAGAPVPAAPTAALLLGGLLGASRRRR